MALPVSVAITVGCSYLLLPPVGVISEENFWEPIRDVVDNTKIRLSYGKLGNRNTGDNLRRFGGNRDRDKPLIIQLDGTSKLQHSKPSDPKTSYLTWETMAHVEYRFGICQFLNNRSTFTGDYFIRNTEGMLADSYELPEYSELRHRTKIVRIYVLTGWELYLGWNDSFALMGKRFNYTVSATLGDNKTVFTEFITILRKICLTIMKVKYWVKFGDIG